MSIQPPPKPKPQCTCIYFLLFMGRLSWALAFPSGEELGYLTAALAPPEAAPGTPRGGGCWTSGAYSLPSHLKQAVNLRRRFSWRFAGRRSCRLREMCHEAGLLCRIKSK